MQCYAGSWSDGAASARVRCVHRRAASSLFCAALLFADLCTNSAHWGQTPSLHVVYNLDLALAYWAVWKSVAYGIDRRERRPARRLVLLFMRQRQGACPLLSCRWQSGVFLMGWVASGDAGADGTTLFVWVRVSITCGVASPSPRVARASLGVGRGAAHLVAR
ncbi:hypothetical protein K437DRAFT_180767 [Tilletiaria anomala UBC 951]|uniref:Uncharacterized protein n=1 Tax=Tilletiaria anomala (strain ATCC 24038 / CBS 436.72 / UBC 951) TaxID=1037660 RepID=A0A066VQJ9_TILAU|nr:uncharacterized protein K437DRAFT_180767 [Tilletiaria anomala UBC 951]KDN41074.1 hypothetical protein K437DRAFT_180767 [Tilletiaria anomala UBC 951]